MLQRINDVLVRGRFFSLQVVFLSFVFFLSACNTSSDPDPSGAAAGRPVYTDLMPRSDQVDVPLNIIIEITFNEALDASTVTDNSVQLLPGKNTDGQIPIAGNLTYSELGGNYVVRFAPNADLAPNKDYTVVISNAIADKDGNHTLYTSYSFHTVAGSANDTTAPTLSSTTPANNAVDVVLNRTIVATFSEQLDSSTIDGNSFYVYVQTDTPQNRIAGSVSYSSGTAVFTPANSLTASTTYFAVVSSAVTDLSGNHLAADYVWSFTTGATSSVDNTPPQVSVVTPRDKASGVPINTSVSATFDEPLNASTVNSASFTLSDAGGTIAGAVSYSGNTASFTPGNPLSANVSYTATLTTAIKDLAGNALTASYSWSFLTESGGVTDVTAPFVTAVSPKINDLVATNALISAEFSEALNPSTVNTASFYLKEFVTGNSVPGSVSYNGISATFKPAADLTGNTIYQATLTADIADLAGNTLAANYAWTFTTSTGADTTPPSVDITTLNPGINATVPVNTAVSVGFSEALNPNTVTTASFVLSKLVNGVESGNVAGIVYYNGGLATFTPSATLEISTDYRASLNAGITDLAGNPLQAYSWDFSVAANTDTTAPALVAGSQTPAPGTTNVAVTLAAVSASFDEALDPSTINASNVSLTNVLTGAAVAGTLSYTTTTNVSSGATTSTISFAPGGSLAFCTGYQAVINTGVTDLAGNPLAANITWGFTTRNGGGMDGGGRNCFGGGGG